MKSLPFIYIYIYICVCVCVCVCVSKKKRLYIDDLWEKNFLFNFTTRK